MQLLGPPPPSLCERLRGGRESERKGERESERKGERECERKGEREWERKGERERPQPPFPARKPAGRRRR